MHRTLLSLVGLLSYTAVDLCAQEKDADTLFRDGVSAFFDAKPAESVAAFDKLIAIAPNAAPQLWQRGLSLYYA